MTHLLLLNAPLRGISNERNTPVLPLQDILNHEKIAETEFNEVLHRQFLEQLSLLALMLRARDVEIYLHSRRVQTLTHRFMRAMHGLDLSKDDRMMIGAAALLHDIGKLGIDATLLYKEARLHMQEFELIKEHSAIGALLIGQFKTMKQVAPIVYHHHERWDGQGYPAGLQGEDIPLGARIVAIADAFDAMTSHRVYSAPRTPAMALVELDSCAGTQFDPYLIEQFCMSMDFLFHPTA